MRILYDSKKTEYKKPFGCLKQNEECTVNLYIPQSCMTESVSVVFEGENRGNSIKDMHKSSSKDGYDIWTAVFSLEKCDLYFFLLLFARNQVMMKLLKPFHRSGQI